MNKTATLMCLLAAASGCATEVDGFTSGDTSGGRVAQAAVCDGASCPDGFVQWMDLISSGTCSTVFGRLRNCEIEARVVLPPEIEWAVPVRTVLRRDRRGNCSTSYPLAVAVSAPELEADAEFRYIQDSELTLRAPGGAPITELTVEDGSPWTGIASFRDSCAISAVIAVNQPDVDSKEEAEAIIAAIELELVRSQRERDAFEQLLLFHGAHEFLYAVAESLHEELSNDMMQQLRQAYLDALPAFDALAGSGSCEAELGDDYYVILELASSMFILGDPADWQNPDGTTKTLADMYSELRGDGVVAQIEALAAAADPSLEEEYQDAYEEAALVVVQLEAKLALARAQLAGWLDDPA